MLSQIKGNKFCTQHFMHMYWALNVQCDVWMIHHFWFASINGKQMAAYEV